MHYGTYGNVAVRFLKNHSVYNAGESAGFTPDVAEVLVNGGVAEYQKKGAKPEVKQPEITALHVEFLQARGYRIGNVKDAAKFVGKFNPEEIACFFADAAEWEAKRRDGAEGQAEVKGSEGDGGSNESAADGEGKEKGKGK